MSALTRIREKLNAEIKVALVMTEAWPTGEFFKGRLGGLLWVRDHVLYDKKEAD